MIFESPTVSAREFHARTGWEVKPEGACLGDRCIPLPGLPLDPIDLPRVAERLQMPLVHDESAGLWALGPESGGHALASAVAPDFTLPDWRGSAFTLSSLRGTKALLVAWASW